PRFRRGPAFARGGAVTYAWFPDAEAMLRRKLEADAEDGLHPVLQAVRAYLDLIFFHPFPDGNARAARLWLEYFLRRAGLPSPPIADLLRLRKLPGDERRAWAFATLTAKGILRGAARAPLAPR
ncbi:MAG: Fic family protein, partial [Planctomycetes bacterium]|nr:Fic family protein [Planctomycetota bacterium]